MNKSKIIRVMFFLSVIALIYTIYWQAGQPPEIPAKRFIILTNEDGKEILRLPLKN